MSIKQEYEDYAARREALEMCIRDSDCMELNLSGAHAPYFTRNIVILTDSNGVEGVGEVPGGEKITKALEDVKHLVLGKMCIRDSTSPGAAGRFW